GDAGGADLRAGAPTAGAGRVEVLLTRTSGPRVSCLGACSLAISAASLSTLCRTAARPRDIATTWSGEAAADAACTTGAARGANHSSCGDRSAMIPLVASP